MRSNKGASTLTRQLARKRQHLIDTGKIEAVPITTTLSEALEAAGL